MISYNHCVLKAFQRAQPRRLQKLLSEETQEQAISLAQSLPVIILKHFLEESSCTVAASAYFPCVTTATLAFLLPVAKKTEGTGDNSKEWGCWVSTTERGTLHLGHVGALVPLNNKNDNNKTTVIKQRALEFSTQEGLCFALPADALGCRRGLCYTAELLTASPGVWAAVQLCSASRR